MTQREKRAGGNGLPAWMQNWFDAQGWIPHPHQRDMLARAQAPASLLIAPTGGGKTLAGFLPSLLELGQKPGPGLHTIYVSPLKALAADIKRNLGRPITEMGLSIRVEDRTGDTSAHRKRKQRADPPHILLTTPESLALLLSYSEAPRLFANAKRIIVDEIHALSENKRGDQLMLALSRLNAIAPQLCRVGLSATVEDPQAMAGYLARHPDPCPILFADPGPPPNIAMLETAEAPPWAGGGGRYAIPEVLDQVAQHKTTLIFHNTRAQAEIFFHQLWLANETDLPIAIHHGSLARAQREKVEAAMAAGQLRAVVCTGSLDLGIDWGDVDLVIQIGAPKNVKRLVQRIGRANHRYNTPSKALLVPANRFETVECSVALDAVRAGQLDGEPRRAGPRDVLCQHIMICACAGPFDASALYQEVITTGSYQNLARQDFDACLDFVASGGYALRAYDQWQRLVLRDGKWQLRDPRLAARFRMNIGTIQDTDTVKVKLKNTRGGTALGEIEESFAASLSPGDTFLVAGQVVAYERLRELTVEVSRRPNAKPKIATFYGTKFSTSTQLSNRILRLFQQKEWPNLPVHTQSWLELQRQRSRLPQEDRLLIESFPMAQRAHTVIYGFAGRNAMQTLGLLVTAKMEEHALAPMGFVATDYALLIWGLNAIPENAHELFESDDFSKGFEKWLAGNAVMKRTFRASATIAGLIARNSVSGHKSGRQATFSSDILYETLCKYDPNHVMLDITREEAMRGLVDFARLDALLARVKNRIDHVITDRVTPLAAPLFFEPGRVPIKGAAEDILLTTQSRRIMAAAGLDRL